MNATLSSADKSVEFRPEEEAAPFILYPYQAILPSFLFTYALPAEKCGTAAMHVENE